MTRATRGVPWLVLLGIVLLASASAAAAQQTECECVPAADSVPQARRADDGSYVSLLLGGWSPGSDFGYLPTAGVVVAVPLSPAMAIEVGAWSAIEPLPGCIPYSTEYPECRRRERVTTPILGWSVDLGGGEKTASYALLPARRGQLQVGVGMRVRTSPAFGIRFQGTAELNFGSHARPAHYLTAGGFMRL